MEQKKFVCACGNEVMADVQPEKCDKCGGVMTEVAAAAPVEVAAEVPAEAAPAEVAPEAPAAMPTEEHTA